ncbi:MAG: type II toxin-antitoxin system RelE/ParE family toxin [Pyrinomonadaceae bacterium]
MARGSRSNTELAVTYSLTVRRAAEADLAEIFTWYESHEPGVGSRFLSETDRAFELIEQRPLSFPILRGRTRRCVLFDFPYSIFFVVVDTRIFITSCVHHSQHPRVWRSRR